MSWRLGEHHFMRHRLDGDLASNNGNWQWSAGVGADHATIARRLYNPLRRQLALDPDGAYLRRWLPELRLLPTELLPTP